MIWNATYAPNLNLIERFWGHLKRSAIHNYYFETVENLEKAVIKAVGMLNRQKNHPLRLPLQTVGYIYSCESAKSLVCEASFDPLFF